MCGAFLRIDWPPVLHLWEMAKPCSQAKHEVYDSKPTGGRSERVYWAPRMFTPIWRLYEPSNHSSVPSRLCELQIVPLPCGLDHLVKFLVYGSLIQSPTSIWATGQYQASHGIMDSEGWPMMRRRGREGIANPAYCFFFPLSRWVFPSFIMILIIPDMCLDFS